MVPVKLGLPLNWSWFYGYTAPWYKHIQSWPFHVTLEVQLPADQSYVVEEKGAQTLAVSGKAVSDTTTYNLSNLRGKHQHLSCAELQ